MVCNGLKGRVKKGRRTELETAQSWKEVLESDGN